jgi:ABC-type Fe3+-hydroxamate transport system substrate-binding protein
MNTKVLLGLRSHIIKDQIGKPVFVPGIPKKIVSLVPSVTELLYDLGLGDRVVGITRYCVHPAAWLQTKTIIGGTKKIDIRKILSLQPDLVLANKEENIKEQVELLGTSVPVYTSAVSNLASALQLIQDIGQLVRKEKKAASLVEKIKKGFASLQKISTPQKLVYVIWRKPYMTAGGDTFIQDMINRMGCTNVFKKKKRYPVFLMNDLEPLKPDFIFLSSEPYPFKEKHIAEVKKIFPDIKMLLVDGEMFSWYGSRLLLAPVYFKQLLKRMQRKD